jgi:hypothetical protein
MQGVINMPILQVRNLPEDIYIKLNMIANKENRSIAQQTIVLLKESLGLHVNNKLRRKALLEKIGGKNYFIRNEIDQVELIRKDRER